ncbi:DUF3994 domain-containing protein [Paenibacillus sp. N1-5-1-14]|uniref:DUF3994 domain-containing protein n=1 Tax=Paenibacillus radicibacter TaxID=2972488 RepID=UPI00215983B4|nr:DUF3994 domain-containing protein [Paenibacillus radicibacter]MCR8644241.1 DUF3994 domain-containing protein [Paenibacillus radicibacter]
MEGLHIKSKWLLSFVLPILLTTGCIDKESSVTTAESKESSQQTAQQSSNQTSQQTQATAPLSKEEYVKAIGAYHAEMGKELQTFSIESKDGKSPNYLQRNKEQIDKLKLVIKKYISLNPPNEFKKIQDSNLEAMSYFDKGLDELYDAVVKRDQDALDRARLTLTKGQDLWYYAFAQLQLTEDIPVLDGTITTKDQKELDKNAGIDRDSVLKNISQNGQELIGQWGVQKDDKFQVLIVLNADGSYKRYKDYPDESSILKGRWEYNYLRRILTLYNDEAYENGKSIKDTTRPKIELDVQAFNHTTIQMMNKETTNTMKYTKAGSTVSKRK